MSQFAQETAVTRVGDNLWHGELHRGWRVGELKMQVLARPTPGPLKGRFYTRHLIDGVVEGDGEFWDSSNRLVCISRQTAKIRIGGRG